MASNSLKSDPSRTGLLRRNFLAEVKRRFAKLRQEVIAFVWRQNELGLGRDAGLPFVRNGLLVVNKEKYAFLTDDQKLETFNKWLQTRIDEGVLSVDGKGQPWTAKYIDSAYKKGLVRSYVDTHSEQLALSPDFYKGGMRQFLEGSFASPEQLSKVKLLGTRTFENMKGVTSEISTKLSRVLADGMAAGDAPGKIAVRMSKEIDSISIKRAHVIARTEIIHAHAEGQLDGFEELGIDELQLDVEILTAGDDRVCPICNGMVGKVFTVKEARGVIPLHPQCRCAWRTVTSLRKRPGKPRQTPLDQQATEQAYEDSLAKTTKELQEQKTQLDQAKQLAAKIAAEQKAAEEAAAKLKAAEEAAAKAKAAAEAELKAQKAAAAKAKKAAAKAAKGNPNVPANAKVIGQEGVEPFSKFPLPDMKAKKGTLYYQVDTSVSLGGSTGAKKVDVFVARATKGKPSKKVGTYVLKTYKGNEDQARNEALANALYRKLAPTFSKPPVPRTALGNVDGKVAIFNQFQDGLKTFDKLDAATQAKVIAEMRKNFVSDAFLSNWDVAGLSMDNIGYVESTGQVLRIDNGGALLFRAQGAPKGKLFGDTVTELDTLRNFKVNPSAAKLYGGMTDKELLGHLDDWLMENGADTYDSLSKAVDASGFTGEQALHLKKTLKNRYSHIVAYRNNLKAKVQADDLVAKAAEVAKTPLKPKPSKPKSGGTLEHLLKKPVPGKTAAQMKAEMLEAKALGMTPEQYAKKKTADRLAKEVPGEARQPHKVSPGKIVNKPADRAHDHVKKFKSDPAYGTLNAYEKGAVHDFTGTYYGSINESVLSGEMPKVVKSLDDALDKLPGYTSISIRGCRDTRPGDWENYISGNWAQVWWKAFSSSTIEPQKEFSSGKKGICYIIRNKGKQGAYVDTISANRGEMELLYKRDSVFRVVGWAEEEEEEGSRFPKHRRYLLIEEVDGDIPQQQVAPKRYDLKELKDMVMDAGKNAGVPGQGSYPTKDKSLAGTYVPGHFQKYVYQP